MAKRKQTEAERIAQIPIEEISKISGADRKQLEGYVRTLQSGYKRRVQSFARKGLVSHAQIALESTLSGAKPISLTKMTRNQLVLEFARYSKFFQGVTSSEEGIRKVNREQDIRLFGKDYKGNPNYQMSQEERERFWRLYEEFQNQNPSKFVNYGYNTVQEGIVEMIRRGQELTSASLNSLMDELSDILEDQYMEENLRSVPNAYSGRGPDF